MEAGSTAEQLYYSREAIDRFATLEDVTRRRQFGYLHSVELPQIIAAHDFISLDDSPIIRTPLFGAWLDRLMQTQDMPTDYASNKERLRRIAHIGNYAATTALATGQEIEVATLSYDGHVMIPEIGRFTIAGSDNTDIRITVGDGITVTSGAARVHVPRKNMAEETPDWQPLRSIGPPDFRIALNDIDPNRGIFRYPVADRLNDSEYKRWHTTFCDAWDFIQEHDPEAAALVRASLTTIVPAPPEPLTHGKSMAAGAAFGVIGINENHDPERLASHLIFGTRKHLALALRAEMPSMYPEDNPLATKPVYPPSREGHGIAMHLVDDSFINIGLTRFFAEVTKAACPDLQEYARLSFARWFVESRQNVDSLRASGYITEENEWLATAMEQEIAACAGGYNDVPDHLKQAVATNVLDRRISWWLHNSTPSSATVHYLRELWLRGEKCPPLEVSAELSASIEAYTHIGQRTRYVLYESRVKDPAHFAALQNGHTDPGRFGNPAQGDIAFASGNVREARNYFDATIRNRPHDLEAWAGFALTFEYDISASAQALLRVPELVAAIYAAIGDPGVAPETVAAWAANCRVTTVIGTR